MSSYTSLKIKLHMMVEPGLVFESYDVCPAPDYHHDWIFLFFFSLIVNVKISFSRNSAGSDSVLFREDLDKCQPYYI